ncbi:cellular nucleic acid-binding protein, partial [Trifolium medium]|nr:cellular nucleic acid-binding protein [Trifolium medium]
MKGVVVEKGKNDGKCYKCGLLRHRAFECTSKEDKCGKCGKLGHKDDECKKPIVCYNCKEEGHKSNVCKKPKATRGKVFALSGDAGEADNLIR